MIDHDTYPSGDDTIDKLALDFMGVVRSGLTSLLDWDPAARSVPPEFEAGPPAGHPALNSRVQFRPAGRMALTS